MKAASPSPGGLRAAADVGGTFTDLVAVDADGGVTRHKTLSTPPEFDNGVLAGLQACSGDSLASLASLLHASTVATNAILERRGPRTGLITTEGFRDVLEIGRLRYPRLYDLSWSRPEPLVERRLRLGVGERMAADGSVVTPLDPRTVSEALDVLEQADVEAVAICLLNSYMNDEHEVEVERLFRERLPEAAVSRSSAVLPLIREYDRTSTTVINAYLQPVMGDYLGRLAQALQRAGSRAPILMLQSSGGVMPAAEAAAAAGVLPGVWADGRGAGDSPAGSCQRGLDRVLAFDMGGTTAKAAVVLDGAPAIAPELRTGRRHQFGDAADPRLGLPAADANHRPGRDRCRWRQHCARIDPAGGSVGWTGQCRRGSRASLLRARRGRKPHSRTSMSCWARSARRRCWVATWQSTRIAGRTSSGSNIWPGHSGPTLRERRTPHGRWRRPNWRAPCERSPANAAWTRRPSRWWPLAVADPGMAAAVADLLGSPAGPGAGWAGGVQRDRAAGRRPALVGDPLAADRSWRTRCGRPAD